MISRGFLNLFVVNPNLSPFSSDCGLLQCALFCMERGNIEFDGISEQTKDMIAGLIGGAFGKIVDYPMDTCKVITQINDIHANQSTSQIIMNTFKNEGFLRFYRVCW